jgi:hypothetical protein
MTGARSFPITVESCWLCGSRLPIDHMVADGGSACLDVRWYCLDTRGCTERWVSRWSSPARTSQQLAAPQLASGPAAVTGLPKRQPLPARPAGPQQAAAQRVAAQRAAAQRAASGQAGPQQEHQQEDDGGQQATPQQAGKQLARQRGPRR